MKEIKNKIIGYGITLVRLTEDKIELVRKWRNDPKISQYMEYREEITPEMQKKWFERINNDFNLYYLIIVDDKEIGLINSRDIDENYTSGEGGIFIWDDDCLNNDISFRASCLFNDYLFLELGLKESRGHILKTNKRAINFNKALGLFALPCEESIVNQPWLNTKETYFNSKARKLITKLYK